MPEPRQSSGIMPTAVPPAQVLPTSQLRAARQQSWEGMHMGYAHFPPGEFSLPPIAGHLITLHLGQPVETIRQRGGQTHQGLKVYGDIEVIPAGNPSFWAYAQANEAFGIILDATLMQQVALEAAQLAPERLELRHHFEVRDPLIMQLGMALYSDLMAPEVGSRLFAESAAQILAVHVLRTYAAVAHPVRAYTRGLTRATLRRVLDYMHAHLDTDLSLTTLAAVVGMSPYHFARLFKQSTGQSPHQYVIDQRIVQAQHFLATTTLPIAAIAYQLGFTSQSHLARHFRQRTGTTPKAYRDACR